MLFPFLGLFHKGKKSCFFNLKIGLLLVFEMGLIACRSILSCAIWLKGGYIASKIDAVCLIF
ncbi:hypothetical protein VN23_05185 [Janthinobacterium sp. B9-8]|nr:hypothetical protein VN23_05185 [Janthinobacterium sp. B9-8]